MNHPKFRQKPKSTASNSVDGFLTPSQKHQDDIRVHFRQSYRPESAINDFHPAPRVEAFSDKKESYDSPTPARATKETSSATTFDLNLDEKSPRGRRWGIFKRKESSTRKKKGFVKRTAQVFGVVTLLFVLGAGSIIGYGVITQGKVFRGDGDGAAALQKNVDPARLNGEGDGRVNVLLLGKGGPGHEAPDLTDTLLLASIDPVQNEAALVSVPRDLFIEDSNGYGTKINAIYSGAKQARLAEARTDDKKELEAAEDAGLKAIKQAVSEVLGVPVHYYVMVDFTAFKESIDTVGGITIDVKEPLYDATMAWMNNGRALIADSGLQSFDGNKALMYARSRYGSARGDFDRSERQKEVIFALQQKVLSVGTFSNPFKILELITTLGNNVRTDFRNAGEVRRLYEIGQNISSDKFVSVGLADPDNLLVTTDSINGQSVVVPLEGLNSYDNIHVYIRNTLKDAFLKSENARVVIMNGTSTPGLASFREKELKSYGYNIVQIDNAPTSDYTKTRLIDVANGQKPYTASYLEKRLGVQKETTVIEGLPTAETADFVILLGTDEIDQSQSN